jgi:hypothetical protein
MSVLKLVKLAKDFLNHSGLHSHLHLKAVLNKPYPIAPPNIADFKPAG